MEKSDANTVLYLDFPKQTQHIVGHRFHKMIPLLSLLNSHELNYFEIIKFLLNLGFIFHCKKVSTRLAAQFVFNIFCPMCNQKLFKIILITTNERGQIYASFLCEHVIVVFQLINTNYSKKLQLIIRIDEQTGIVLKKNFHKFHPVKIVGKLIHAYSSNNILKMYLEKLVFSASHAFYRVCSPCKNRVFFISDDIIITIEFRNCHKTLKLFENSLYQFQKAKYQNMTFRKSLPILLRSTPVL